MSRDLERDKINIKGFTIIELLVALTILVLAAAAFVPLFSYVAKANQNNKTRVVAENIANSVIEGIRALPYEVRNSSNVIDITKAQIGTKGGSPPGLIKQVDYRTIEGVEYIIKTLISWGEANASDGTINVTAFKKIRVIVEAPSVFLGGVAKASEIYSIASKEGEQMLDVAGHLRVNMQNSKGLPLVDPSIQVYMNRDISSIPHPIAVNQSVMTDNDGRALFGVIPEGKYFTKILLPSNMVCRPDITIDAERWITNNIATPVSNWNVSDVEYQIDNPAYIKLDLRDSLTNEQILGQGNLTIQWNQGSLNKVVKNNSFAVTDFDIYNMINSSFCGNLWPVGNYNIKLDSVALQNEGNIYKNIRMYQPYDMSTVSVDKRPKKQDGTAWDGTLGATSSTTPLTVTLEPSLLCWLSADSITDAVEGQAVTNWLDNSGYSNSATQASVTSPVYKSDVIKGKPVLRFDGKNLLQLSSGFSATNDFTIFCIAESTVSDEIDSLSNNYGGTTGQHYLFGAPHMGANAGAGVSMGNNGLSVYEHGDSYMPAKAVYSGALSGFKLITVKYKGKVPYIYVNGVLSSTGTVSTKSTVYCTNQIGGGAYGNFTGDIAEVLIYKSSLSDSCRQLVEAYLTSKYLN